MQVNVEPGTYVIAVSGGVDSMALLDMLSRQPDIALIVAHFEHGIRPDSDDDRLCVAETAKKYGLPFAFRHGSLGAGASEAQARTARYAFLREIQHQYGARAIITAHHEDDVLETVILNLVRGTGRKGLHSLRSDSDGLLRPLLNVPKQEIIAYAHKHGITWNEDSTNASDVYMRNYVRHHVLPRLGVEGRRRLLGHIRHAAQTNELIDSLLSDELHAHKAAGGLERSRYAMLPHAVSTEVMAAWLRANGVREFDRNIIERLVIAAKTGKPGSYADVNADWVVAISSKEVRFMPRSAR